MDSYYKHLNLEHHHTAENIKDVIAFPKNQNAFCYLSEAPNVVDEKQIDELGLIITKKEEE